MERSSRVLHHGNPEMWKFFKKFEIDKIEFCPYPEFPNAEKINHLSLVNISPTSVIDMSTERASRVLQHGNQKIWFFQKKVRNWIWLVFWLKLKSFNQLSRSRHAPICRHRDASSSLWGSTSSFFFFFFFTRIRFYISFLFKISAWKK